MIEIRRHSAKEPWTYAMLDRRQREIARRVREGGAGALLLSEVAPVITLGRRTAPGDLLLAREELARRGIEVLPTDRGGLATYHGPGQWVLFAVDSLERLTGDRRGVRKAVDGLLSLALDACVASGVRAEIRSGCELGVWSSRGPSDGTPRGKLASIGVHIEQRVLLHGLAVNGFRTETSFVGLRPCGLDAPVDFVLERAEPALESSSDSISQAFEALGNRLREAALARFWPDFRQG